MLGQTIAHYKILEELGAGGMGLVYKAEDLLLHRIVALKILPRELTLNEEAKHRFTQEAQAASAIDHPNVCTIYEVGETDDGTSYIAMAYCRGEPLEQRIRRGPFPPEDALKIALQIAAGLQKAHDGGIIHRDLKPANVVLSADGQAKIIDFGLAKLRGRSRFTNERTTLGTLEYMSPEQARGEDVDQRTDIWSLGCLLYELFTGVKPFKGDYEQAIVYAILNTSPAPVSEIRTGLPPGLDAIMTKALAKSREDRYGRVEDLMADLRALQPGAAASRPHSPFWKRAAFAAGGALLAVLVILLFKPSVPVSPPERKSVAVLPFMNLTGDKEDEYFSDGITDDILTQLYKIGDLKVISRTTMQQFRDTRKSIREIGEELDVSAVLEGSVRRAGDRVRIVAQLIDTRTDDHLWAENYDRSMEDVFGVQSEIAQHIAQALHATLTEAEEGRLRAPLASSAEAYNRLLEGRHAFARGTREDVARSVDKFLEAIAIDSNSAPAWAYLATAYARLADVGALSTDEGYGKAREAALKSLALDGQLAQAHTIMGWIKRSYDWDWAGAAVECRRALELAPGDVSVIRNMANLQKSLGQFDEAIALLEKAAVLDPKRPPIFTSLGLLSMYADRLEAAAAAYRKAIALNPEYPAAHAFLGLVYLRQGDPGRAVTEIGAERDEGWRLYALAQAYHGAGRRAEADTALQRLITQYGDESTYQVAQAYAYRGENDSAFAWLERAYVLRDGGLSELKGDPFMKKLEHDPRYAAFMGKMRLTL